MISTLLQVAAGGAIGAAARYATGVGVARVFGVTGFPLGVLAVNVVGSFLMGVLAVTLARKGMAHMNAFLMTGVLGGFTTFSAFSLEAVTLYERGAPGQAAAYVILSVTLSIAALFAGFWLAREVIL